MAKTELRRQEAALERQVRAIIRTDDADGALRLLDKAAQAYRDLPFLLEAFERLRPALVELVARASAKQCAELQNITHKCKIRAALIQLSPLPDLHFICSHYGPLQLPIHAPYVACRNEKLARRVRDEWRPRLREMLTAEGLDHDWPQCEEAARQYAARLRHLTNGEGREINCKALSGERTCHALTELVRGRQQHEENPLALLVYERWEELLWIFLVMHPCGLLTRSLRPIAGNHKVTMYLPPPATLDDQLMQALPAFLQRVAVAKPHRASHLANYTVYSDAADRHRLVYHGLRLMHRLWRRWRATGRAVAWSKLDPVPAYVPPKGDLYAEIRQLDELALADLKARQ